MYLKTDQIIMHVLLTKNWKEKIFSQKFIYFFFRSYNLFPIRFPDFLSKGLMSPGNETNRSHYSKEVSRGSIDSDSPYSQKLIREQARGFWVYGDPGSLCLWRRVEDCLSGGQRRLVCLGDTGNLFIWGSL